MNSAIGILPRISRAISWHPGAGPRGLPPADFAQSFALRCAHGFVSLSQIAVYSSHARAEGTAP